MSKQESINNSIVALLLVACVVNRSACAQPIGGDIFGDKTRGAYVVCECKEEARVSGAEGTRQC